MKQVTVLAPAKLNLTLDVTGLLPGGYHALDMIMQTITLYEKVTLRKSQDLVLRCREAGCLPTIKTPPTKRRWPFFTTPGCWLGWKLKSKKIRRCVQAWRAEVRMQRLCWWG